MSHDKTPLDKSILDKFVHIHPDITKELEKEQTSDAVITDPSLRAYAAIQDMLVSVEAQHGKPMALVIELLANMLCMQSICATACKGNSPAVHASILAATRALITRSIAPIALHFGVNPEKSGDVIGSWAVRIFKLHEEAVAKQAGI